MKKYDVSLLEVWKWKGNVFEDLKDLTNDELIDKINNSTEKILSDNSINLISASSKKSICKC